MELTKGKIITIIAAVFAIAIVSMAAFIIEEDRQAVVTRFGRPIRVIAGARDDSEREEIRKEIEAFNQKYNSSVRLSFGAGLYFKMPFLDAAEEFENRLLQYDAPPEPTLTADKKQLLVDTFARWRISNPLLYRQTVRTEIVTQKRLDSIIFSVVRDLLASHNFNEIIRTSNEIFEREREEPLPDLVKPIEIGRTKIMQEVTTRCDKSVREYGIRIMDVRVKRADLPKENRKRVYERMSEERKRIATRWREGGKADAAQLRATTDKEVTIMLAEAERESQVLHGQGDAEALRIYARGYEEELENGTARQVFGYESDPDFYEFTRKLQALENVTDASTTFVLSTDSDLFGILRSIQPAKRASSPLE